MAIGDLQLPLYPWGSLAPMMTPMAKAQSNVTASNIPGAKIPGPYDFLNAMTSLSNVQGENALRQQQMGLVNTQLQAQQFALDLQQHPEKANALLDALMGKPPTAGGGSVSGMQPQAAPQLASSESSGDVHDPRGLSPFIKQTATKYGIDPDTAIKVAQSEGLSNPVGDNGTSHGAFQLHTAPGAVGDLFKRTTGLDPADPKNEQATIDFGLKYAAQNGWGAWSGAKKLGLKPFEGIGKAPEGQGVFAASLGGGTPDTVENASTNGSTPAAQGYTGKVPTYERAPPLTAADVNLQSTPLAVHDAFVKYRQEGGQLPIEQFMAGGGAPSSVLPVRLAQSGPMPSLAGSLPPQGSMPQGAPPGQMTPQMPGSLSGGFQVPTINGYSLYDLARRGAAAEFLKLPNMAKPMFDAAALDPNFMYQKGLMEALSKLPTAELQARLSAIGKNAVTPEQSRTGSQTNLPVYDAQGNLIGQRMLGYNPKIAEGQTQVQLPNGQIAAVDVPGAAQGIQNEATLKAAGPAAFKQEDVFGPYGQTFRTTALNAAGMLGSGQGAAAVAPVAPGGGNLAVGGAMPAPTQQGAPGALPPAQSTAPQRPYAAPPNFPVPMAGGKDLDQLSVNDMFAAGLKPTEPPKPPPGSTYGPASVGLSDLQKQDAQRVEGYGKEAAENQKAYQDLGHLGDILDHGMNTGKLTPLWADLNNIARSLGAPEIFPANPESQAAFDKATTDLTFAAVKKMGGRVLVSEIEGFQKANPNSTLPTAANRSIISDILASGKWQDARARLAQQYLTGTGGAPLADFEAQFNRMAPLDSVSNNYRNTFRQAGWKFPEDTTKSAPPAGPQIIQHEGKSYLKHDGKFYSIQP